MCTCHLSATLLPARAIHAEPHSERARDVKSRSEEPTKRRREEEEDENILHAGRTHMTRDTHTHSGTASRTQIIRKEAITSCRDRSNRRGTHRGTDHPPNRPWKEGSLLCVSSPGFVPRPVGGSGESYESAGVTECGPAEPSETGDCD